MPHIVDDEIVWSQLPVLHTVRVMGTDVEHSLSPVGKRISMVLEDAVTIVAESTNSFRRGADSYKVGNSMGNPTFKSFRRKPQFTTDYRELAG
jgi:hypothetical protein